MNELEIITNTDRLQPNDVFEIKGHALRLLEVEAGRVLVATINDPEESHWVESGDLILFMALGLDIWRRKRKEH